MADPQGQAPGRPFPAPFGKAISGRSSPLSSDFEDLGADEGRSMSLTSGQSGVLVDDATDGPTSERPASDEVCSV